VTGFDPGAVQATVLARILAWRVDLPLTLRDPLDEMLKRRRYLLVDDVPDYFGPRTTPLLSMPLWLTAALRAQGHTIPDAAAIDAAEAALTGYFLIRVIDDHVDEGTGDSGAVVLLASALQARMTAVFARVAPRGSPFWPLLDEVFTTAGDAMLRERALLTGPGIQSEAEFTALLGRYDPLLLAGAALLAAADDWRLLDPLRAIVRHLGASVQRFNDAFDAPADLAAGRRTWAVCRCAPDSDPDRLHDRLQRRRPGSARRRGHRRRRPRPRRRGRQRRPPPRRRSDAPRASPTSTPPALRTSSSSRTPSSNGWMSG
jgi:hypothetical protein